MDPQIASLKELFTQRLDGFEERVITAINALTVQVKETNGRLRMEEAATADFRPRVSALEREIGEEKRFIRRVVDVLTDALEKARTEFARGIAAIGKGENRKISLWDVYLAVATIAGTVSVIKFFGLLK